MAEFTAAFGAGFDSLTELMIPTSYVDGVVRRMPYTSKSIMGFPAYSFQRLPTDAFYIADVDIQNMVIGSRYALGYDSSGVFVTLATGVSVATDFTIPNVSAFGSPFLMELRVRKGTTSTKYLPLRTFAFHSSLGVTIYVSQVEDTVA